MSEQDIEKEIQDKGLTAPRLTPADIDAVMVNAAQFHVFPGTTVTICLLELKNGFTVTGESACASPENFDSEIGERIALTNAREKVWALEGYLLKQRLHDQDSRIEAIARMAHEVNRSYCQALGDNSQPAWEDAPEWQRSSAINGVRFHLANPEAGPDHSHNSWLQQKDAEGWKYGPVKDPEKKEHPCFVPYEQLPVEQKAKDFLFRGVVHAMK